MEHPRPGESDADFLRRMRYEGEQAGYAGTILEGNARTPDQQKEDEAKEERDRKWSERPFDFEDAVLRPDAYIKQDEWGRHHFGGRTAVKENLPFFLKPSLEDDDKLDLCILVKADEHGMFDEVEIVFTGYRAECVREMIQLLVEGHNEYWSWPKGWWKKRMGDPDGYIPDPDAPEEDQIQEGEGGVPD